MLEPSYKGLLNFTRGYSDEHRLKLRLRALDCTKTDLQSFASLFMLPAIESGKTSRVVFGSQTVDAYALAEDGWSVHNPMDFLSTKYFDRWNDNQEGK